MKSKQRSGVFQGKSIMHIGPNLAGRTFTVMRILFLTDNFVPERNAPAQRTFDHCRIWAQAGADVTVITGIPNFPAGKPFDGYRNRLSQREQIEGVDVLRVWTYMAPNAGRFRRTFDFASFMVTSFAAGLFQKCDVIVATSPQLLTAVSAFLLSGIKRRPWVMEVRDVWPDSIVAVGAMSENVLIRFLRFLERRLYRSAALIVAVHEGVRDQMTSKGVPQAKISIISNGADLGCSPSNDPHRSIRTDDRFVVGYFGTHGMAQGLSFVLDAADVLKSLPIRFVFVGDGSERSALQARAAQMKNVEFLEPVPSQDVPAYMADCDLILVPLKEATNAGATIPSKIFSIAAAGRPFVFTGEGVGAELVRRYGAGIVTPPGDADALARAITKLRQDPSLRERLAANGLGLAADFDRRKLAQKMLEHLRELCVERATDA
jgi:glycosyltransferase involved in cell wall biosynthesis